jgi:uracil-DNA glycosylase
VAFVGEAPGSEEDVSGEPFVGPAGQLLDRMIQAMGYGLDEVYVCNAVKCRPPANRTPSDLEVFTCMSHFLSMQLPLVRPKVIVALGRSAAKALGIRLGAGWRGQATEWRGIWTVPTYHPAYLLRDPSQKRAVWVDLQWVLVQLGKPIPGGQ